MRTRSACTIALLSMVSVAYGKSVVGHGAATEHGSPLPGLRLGTPSNGVTLDRVAVQMRVDDTIVMTTLVLELSTTRRELQDSVLPLELPPGTRATGLAITIGGQRATAAPMPRDEAFARYQQIVAEIRDPALLELPEAGRARDRFQLHVFPITSGAPASVEITLEVPRTPLIAIDPAGQTIGRVDVELEQDLRIVRASWSKLGVAKSIAVGGPRAPRDPDPTPEYVAPRKHVDTATALLAGKPTLRTPELGTGAPAIGGRWSAPTLGHPVDKHAIRAMMRLHEAQLARCYSFEAQRDPSLEGDVNLHFMIGEAGKVTVEDITGDLEHAGVRSCVAALVGSLAFPPGDPVDVHYPLHFTLPR